MGELGQVGGTPYLYDVLLQADLDDLQLDVTRLRSVGALDGKALKHIAEFFRVKSIYNSNAIEGNLLNYGETRLVVEQGLTISGKPLKDTLEAKNLSAAMDMLEELATQHEHPIRPVDVRAIHAAVLSGIDDINAGKWRDIEVEITGSKYRPSGPEKVPQEMDEFCDWFERVSIPGESDQNPVLLACAAHAWFVVIHPFVDGNGRVARILMNLILMRYGYPIAIVTKDDRSRYYEALEQSQACDLTPFVALISECVHESLEEWNRAATEQMKAQEWATSVVGAFGQRELVTRQNEYEVWRSAMELLRSYVKQTADAINQAPSLVPVHVHYRDYGVLEIEKYLSLRGGESVKQTWFFKIEFECGDKTARYLFFFGFASYEMKQVLGEDDVSLHVARESQDRAFYYEKLTVAPEASTPDLVEIAYLPNHEKFACKHRNGAVTEKRVETFVKEFIEQVAKREF